jgi:hypothetical protein
MNDAKNNLLFDFNKLLLHFIIYIIKNIVLLNINILDYNLDNISNLNNYFLIYLKNKLIELYHYIYIHNDDIVNFYKNADSNIIGIEGENYFNLIFW